jgi:hypothetical protein
MGVQSQPQYTTLSSLVDDIQSIMQVYRRNVLDSIENNIDKCADIFIDNAKKISPPDDGPGIGGHYRNMWGKKKLRKAKYVVYVGNSKKVKRHQKDAEPAIPLINILEFSPNPKKKRPHVGKAVANSKNQIIDTIANGIEKVSK